MMEKEQYFQQILLGQLNTYTQKKKKLQNVSS